jgi:hypothetical protein
LKGALVGLARASLSGHAVDDSADNRHGMRRLAAQDPATPFAGSRRMTAWLRGQG